MVGNFINQLNGVSNGCFDTVQFQLQLRNLPGSNSATGFGGEWSIPKRPFFPFWEHHPVSRKCMASNWVRTELSGLLFPAGSLRWILRDHMVISQRHPISQQKKGMIESHFVAIDSNFRDHLRHGINVFNPPSSQINSVHISIHSLYIYDIGCAIAWHSCLCIAYTSLKDLAEAKAVSKLKLSIESVSSEQVQA
jgi:hypothetical protein